MLLHIQITGEVNIIIREFNGNNEFIRYTLTDQEGKLIRAGVIAKGRTIRFGGEAGRTYSFSFGSRGASAKLEVTGASIAYKSYPTGFQIDGRFMDETLPLYFFVPGNIKSYSITLGTKGVVDIFSHGGKKYGQLKDESRLVIRNNYSESGFWKVVFHKTKGNIDLTLDDQLPQWFITDPAHPLKIMPAE